MFPDAGSGVICKLTGAFMEEQIFSWSFDGFGSRLFRVVTDGRVQFINRYSAMETFNSSMSDSRHSEVKYGSFDEFWSEFTEQPLWLHYRPVFVHREVRPVIRETLLSIPQGSISMSEMLRLSLWFFKTGDEI